MSYYSRLTKSFEGALRLPLTEYSKYVLISDCHRGIGNANDNFLKNSNLYLAALQYYYNQGYTYIELGDGDELWENRCMKQIMETYGSLFQLLTKFQKQGRLYMIYGNHDMVKKNISAPPAIILENHMNYQRKALPEPMDVYITHGHQTELINSTLWRFSRFLVRYFWKPLESFGVLDPTSAAKNSIRKQKAKERLKHWAESENHILITGHTHQPYLFEEDKYYYNSGSCVNPQAITCLEIYQKNISLVKWSLATRQDMSVYVAREVLSGPVGINR